MLNSQARILPFKPMSNAERQRQFRERNPGYYGRLHRKRRAEAEAYAAARAAQLALQLAPASPERELVIPMAWILAQFQRDRVEVKRAA